MKSFFRLTAFALTCATACSDTDVTPLQSDEAISMTSITADCSGCTYVVPPKTHIVDGAILNLKPGSIIGLDASITYGNLLFRNIIGTADQPIIIRNCNGKAILNGTGLSFSLKTETSKYFRITGGDESGVYGIQVKGGHLGITLDKLSTNFEIDHVEVEGTGFAGIMAKTDPTCDDATIRGNFTMSQVYFHDNYVHDSGGEGFYVGNSFYQYGKTLTCGARLPHEIHNLKLYNNIVKNTGWDGIQVGSATKSARVYGNTVENYGMVNKASQRSGIQIGEGTGGLCYGNLIKGGTGNGITILGLGDNVIHNNIVVSAGGFGMFCDERFSPGNGFKFINNTIINPGSDGIRIYSEKLPNNVIINNIIANPGSYTTYTYPRSSDDSFIYKLSAGVKIDLRNNFFTTNIDDVKFADSVLSHYRLSGTSSLIDSGADISSFTINVDYYKKPRLKGLTYDIGASEY